MKNKFIVILLLVFVLSFSLGTIAAPNLQEVKVNIDYGMQMFLNGQPFNPTNSQDGTAYRPIIYKNKIYLPAREICNVLNLAIDYNSQNNVLNIGERKDYIEVKVEDFKNIKSAAYTKDADLLFTPNKVFKYGIVKNYVNDIFYGVEIKPLGKYSKFSTSIYLGDNSKKPIIFEFKDGSTKEILKSVEIKPGETKDIEFSILGVDTITLLHDDYESPKYKIILGEPKFK